MSKSSVLITENVSTPQELAAHGHDATMIPVLSFKFVSLKTLSEKVMCVCQVGVLTLLYHVFFHLQFMVVVLYS